MAESQLVHEARPPFQHDAHVLHDLLCRPRAPGLTPDKEVHLPAQCPTALQQMKKALQPCHDERAAHAIDDQGDDDELQAAVSSQMGQHLLDAQVPLTRK
jgi:hypothetical protein